MTPPLLVVLFATLPALAGFRVPLFTLDEAMLLVYPEQMIAGRVPNRDFFTVYGPGGLALLAAVYGLVGPTVLAERAVGLLYHVSVATGVFALTRPTGRWAACTAGILSALLLLPLGLGAYSWLGALALVIWSVALLDQPSARTTMAAGVLGALAVSWRLEMVAPVMAATIPYLVHTRRTRRWLLGAAIGSIPVVVHLVLAGPALYDNVAGRIGVDSGRPLSLDEPDVVLALILILATAAVLVVDAVRQRSRRSISLAFLCLLLLPQALQRIDLGHLLYVGCILVPVAAAEVFGRSAVVARAINRLGPNWVKAAAATTAVTLLVALTVQSVVSLVRLPEAQVVHGSRSLPALSQREQKILERVVLAVNRHVPSGSRIFVGSEDMSVPTLNDMRLYHLLPEYQASAYYLDLPAPREGTSPLVPDIMRAQALILVDVGRRQGRVLFPNVPSGADDADRLVDEHFCVKERVAAYRVYTRCR